MAVSLGTVAPVGFDDFADLQWVELMKQLGCSSVQVYRNRHGNDSRHKGPVTLQQIKDHIAATELPCDSIHGLYGNDLDVSAPDESVRTAAMDTYKAEGDLAMELGGPLVVVHCSGIVKRDLTAVEQQIRCQQLASSMTDLAEFGNRRGVVYAFENLPPYHAIGSNAGELAAMLASIDSHYACMCFDVAHANLAGNAVKAYEKSAGQTRYMHICDNRGERDDHLMPFYGDIEWMAFAAAISKHSYDGVAMLETFYKMDELQRLIDEGIAEKLNGFIDRAGESHFL